MFEPAGLAGVAIGVVVLGRAATLNISKFPLAISGHTPQGRGKSGMIATEDLYIMDVAEFTKDLYRMGNAKWPAFTEERARVDVALFLKDGIEMVVANGNGFSAFDHLTKIMRKPGKKVWRIRKGAVLPSELRLVKDKRPGHEGHYMIAPSQTMPLKKYLGALEDLGLDRARVERVVSGGVANVG